MIDVPSTTTDERRRRDRGIGRLSRVTRAIGVAIVVLVGALALYVGRAFPGHQASANSGAGTVQRSQLSPPTSQLSPPTSRLSPPTSPPTSTPAPPPVTSAPS